MKSNALYYGDNLVWLQDKTHFPDESVDLIYLDPPFNSNTDYNIIFNEKEGDQSQAQLRAFDDTWKWEKESAHEALLELIVSAPTISEFIRWLSRRGDAKCTSTAAYLSMMAVRLMELHRVLKPTGSIYLHCDATASHYLKVLMDAIFGSPYFKNEIVWQRTKAGKPIYKNLPKNTDSILWYTKSDNYYFQPVMQSLSDDDIATFNLDDNDNRGKYNTQPIINPGYRPNLRYIYKDLSGREWQPPKNGWRFNENRMHELENNSRLQFKNTIREKYYLSDRLAKGKQLSNVWSDIPIRGKVEYLGYPTQKPEALLERIINASSKEGDIILDPFCGCGTSIVVANNLNRRWMGIDVTYLAIDLIEKRLIKDFDIDIKRTYKVHGNPFDTASAQALFDKDNKDKHAFELWALSLVDARSRIKDNGVDGIIGFIDDSGEPRRIVVQVKGGANLTPTIIRDLDGTVKNEGAAMGLLISLHTPTKGIYEYANHAGDYKSTQRDKPFQMLQVRTIDELLHDNTFDLPMWKKATK